jgi:hypothetical protein
MHGNRHGAKYLRDNQYVPEGLEIPSEQFGALEIDLWSGAGSKRNYKKLVKKYGNPAGR